MTNQEAIKRIKEHIAIHKYRESHAIHIVEALEMAISALQEQDLQPNLQPTCNLASNDCIGRQAVIDAITTWDKFGADERSRIVTWYEGLEPYVHLRDVVTAIVNLPSVQPEIIHCRECKYYHDSDGCFFSTATTRADGFCHWAERKEGEADEV